MSASAPTDVQVIEPAARDARGRVRELVAYRSLLRFFGRRAVDKIANRTMLGVSWLVIRPLGDTVTRALIFGGVLKAPSAGVPYFLFFVTGMMVWRLMDRSLFWATRAIEINHKLTRKMYFPRLLLPVASTVPGLVEFVVYVGLTALAIGFYGLVDGELYLSTGPELLLVVPALALAFGLALGIGLVTSVLGAYGRDTRYTLVYVLEFWMFVTPVIYPLEALPGIARDLAMINPMTPVVEAVKYGLLGAGELEILGLAYTAVVVAVVIAGGLRFFARFEAISIDSL